MLIYIIASVIKWAQVPQWVLGAHQLKNPDRNWALDLQQLGKSWWPHRAPPGARVLSSTFRDGSKHVLQTAFDIQLTLQVKSSFWHCPLPASALFPPCLTGRNMDMSAEYRGVASRVSEGGKLKLLSHALPPKTSLWYGLWWESSEGARFSLRYCTNHFLWALKQSATVLSVVFRHLWSRTKPLPRVKLSLCENAQPAPLVGAAKMLRVVWWWWPPNPRAWYPSISSWYAAATHIPQAFQIMRVAAVSDPSAGVANMEKGFLRNGKSQGNLLCGKLIGRYSCNSLEKQSHTFHFSEWKICGQTARFVSLFCALGSYTAMTKLWGVSVSKMRGPPLVKLYCLWN